ncbi:MAG: flavodoxin family protein [Candidatus Latescibacteria bacterium]|jgi:multimeric flavodoxin WrbA|nr:flavodoxin family protein [Candidatus Latescibacterota bacterium]
MSPSPSAILAIAGSPREDGNTDILVRAALRLLEERTGASTEFVRVADLNILPCTGCRECMALGHCAIQDDDFESLMAKVFACDLLLLGAPVYWLGPPGIMKNFIDRTHGYYLDHTVLRGKRAALISVATDGGFDPHEAVMRSWLQIYGAAVEASIRVFSCEKGEVLERPDEFAKVRQLVDAIAG